MAKPTLAVSFQMHAHKALATAGTLINMVHEQNKARRKTDRGLKKVSKYILTQPQLDVLTSFSLSSSNILFMTNFFSKKCSLVKVLDNIIHAEFPSLQFPLKVLHLIDKPIFNSLYFAITEFLNFNLPHLEHPVWKE